MKPIKYVEGDATDPQGPGRKIIAHVCNDAGGWGAGFVLALSARSSTPQQEYRRWYRNWITVPYVPGLASEPPFRLGEIQFAYFRGVQDDVWVCNMIAQHGTDHSNGPAIRYPALRRCLRNLATAANAAQATVHMPRIGCGLAGGKWEKVQPIIMTEMCSRNVEITVYDLPRCVHPIPKSGPAQCADGHWLGSSEHPV